jgi:hypothetical protein
MLRKMTRAVRHGDFFYFDGSLRGDGEVAVLRTLRDRGTSSTQCLVIG